MAYSIYDSFTIEDAASVGKTFKARCIGNRGFEHLLTNGKEYLITITPRVLPITPLCSFTNDQGKQSECHLSRFEKCPTE